MKFKKNNNVNTIEYYAQCTCVYATCSCSSCDCTCYSPHTFNNEYESIHSSKFDSRYDSNAYAEELSIR